MKKTILKLSIIFTLFGFLLFGACSKECDPGSFRVERLDPPEKCSASIPGQYFGGLAVSKEGDLYLTSVETIAANEGDSSKLLHCLYILDRDCKCKKGINIKGDFIYTLNPMIGENGDIYIFSGENTKDEKTKPFLNSISSSGELNWILELEKFRYGSSPAIDINGNIYVNGGTILYSVSITGNILWHLTFHQLGDKLILGPGDTIYVYETDSADINENNGTLHKISADGKIVWSTNINDLSLEEGGIYIWDLAMDMDGMIYLHCFSRRNISHNYENHYLVKLNSQGDILWKILIGTGDFDGPPAPLLIGQGIVYVQIIKDMTHLLFAFNTNDGSLKWTFDQEGWPGVIDKDGNVYLTSSQGLLAVDSLGEIKSVKSSKIMPWLMDQDGFIYYYFGPLKITYSESDGYYPSGWSMINHDPQNTNRWNGGS